MFCALNLLARASLFGALHSSRSAPTNSQAPPRPCSFRELFALANDCVRAVLPLTCHPERREPCAANEAELLRVERSRRRSSKQKREALVPKRDLVRSHNSFPKGKLHPLSWEHPHYKNVTFLWQDKSNSLRDPCVAPLLDFTSLFAR